MSDSEVQSERETQRAYVIEKAGEWFRAAIFAAFAKAPTTRAEMERALELKPGAIAKLLNRIELLTLDQVGDLLWAAGCEIRSVGVGPLDPIAVVPASPEREPNNG